MQFRPVVSAIFNAILLIKISTACGEAVLFLPACYFFQHAISSSVLFRPACNFENNRMLPL